MDEAGRDRTRLTLEALRELRVGEFDSDNAVQPRVTAFPNLADAGRAETCEQFVRTNAAA